MKKYITLILTILVVLCSSVVVYAENGQNNVSGTASDSNAEYFDESIGSDSEIILDNRQNMELPEQTVVYTDSEIVYDIEFPESIGTYALNEDDYNSSGTVGYALNNSVYGGSYNSTILSIWNGLIQNNVGKDYVAYRADQYNYYIFFGEDFEYNNGRFSGTGTYYKLNTQQNAYNFTVGTDTFSVNVNGAYLYTNVTGNYPALDNDRGLIYEQIQAILLIALLSFNVLRWIFINR